MINTTHYSVLFLLLVGYFAFSQDTREIGNLVLEDIPEIPENLQEQYQHYQNVRSAQFVDWLPGGEGILMATRFGNTSQLHTVTEPGGSRHQITFFKEPVSNGSFCPNPKYNGFLFTKDSGGNEFSQIFWYDRDTGSSELLSDGKSRNFAISWSNKGDQFAFTSTRKNGKDMDVHISKMASPKTAELKVDRGNGHYWTASRWSPDDTKLLINQYKSNVESSAHILDVESGELTPLNTDQENTVFRALAWDVTGENVYMLSNEGSEFDNLIKFNIKNKKYKSLTTDISWDVEDFTISKDRTKAVFSVNENGIETVYFLDLTADTYSQLASIPKGQIDNLAFSPSGKEIAFGNRTIQSTTDVYSLQLENKTLTRWTASETGGMNASQFPEIEFISYETFDNVKKEKRKIPAVVYRPKEVKEKMPVVISIHGGPESQHVPAFRSLYAYLVNELNVVIIAPNVRGSSGYGKTYLSLDNVEKREESVKDIGALIEWIKNNPKYDADRIAVIGGSYGGYMSLATMVHYSDQLRCGIDLFGISNFVSFLERTEAYRRDLRRAEYGDERDPKVRKKLEEISPANHADQITKPLFVLQGANDPRVPASESEQMVASIRKDGGKVWYLLAKDEGHGFRKKENRTVIDQAIALFLKEYLLE